MLVEQRTDREQLCTLHIFYLWLCDLWLTTARQTSGVHKASNVGMLMPIQHQRRNLEMNAMQKPLRYIMQDQVHGKIATIMNDRATRPKRDPKGYLFPSLLLAALILVQTILSANSA